MSYQNDDDARDLYEWEREQDSLPYFEPRFCCPRHPGSVISNGMFDSPCGECEHEYYEDEIEAQMIEEHGGVDAAPYPAFDPEVYYAVRDRRDQTDEIPF